MVNVFELTKKTFLFYVGVTAYAIEKTEEVIKDLVKKGETTVADRKTEKLNALVREKVADAVSNLDVPSKKDFDELMKKVDAISRKIK